MSEQSYDFKIVLLDGVELRFENIARDVCTGIQQRLLSRPPFAMLCVKDRDYFVACDKVLYWQCNKVDNYANPPWGYGDGSI